MASGAVLDVTADLNISRCNISDARRGGREDERSGHCSEMLCFFDVSLTLSFQYSALFQLQPQSSEQLSPGERGPTGQHNSAGSEGLTNHEGPTFRVPTS